MNAGMAVVNWLYSDQLQVDSEWAQQIPNGFRWWADRNLQTVEVIGQEEHPDGLTGPASLVSIRTELLRKVDLDEVAMGAINAVLSGSAALAGPVYDEDTRAVSLCSLVRVHDDVEEWTRAVLSIAAAMQLAQARAINATMARALGGELAHSHHPYSGPRKEPDEVTRVVEQLVLPVGDAPVAISRREFAAVHKQFEDLRVRPASGPGGKPFRPPSTIPASSSGQSVTADFPYGPSSSLCQIFADRTDPLYGSGLLLEQTFPWGTPARLESRALALNKVELATYPLGYGVGSYCAKDGFLQFRSFFPNLVCRPGLLANVYLSAAARSEALWEVLGGGSGAKPGRS